MFQKLNKQIDNFLNMVALEILNHNVFYQKIESRKLVLATKLAIFGVLIIFFCPEIVLGVLAFFLKSFIPYYLLALFAGCEIFFILAVCFCYLKVRKPSLLYKKLLFYEKRVKTKEQAWRKLTKEEIANELKRINCLYLLEKEDLKALYLWKTLSKTKQKEISQKWKARRKEF